MSLIKAYKQERLMIRALGNAAMNGVDFSPYRKKYAEIKEKHVNLDSDAFANLLMQFSNETLDELESYKVSDITFYTAIYEILGYIALNGKDLEVPKVMTKTFDGVFLMSIIYHKKCVNAFRDKRESENALSYGWNAFQTQKPLVPLARSAAQLDVARNQTLEKYHVDCNVEDLKKIIINL